MKNSIFILAFTGLAFYSCDVIELSSGVETPSDNDIIQGPQTVPGDQTLFLDFLHGEENKSWEASGFTIAGITGFQDCRLDDQIVLHEDGTYEYNAGNFLCGAEDNQSSRNGTWSLNFSQSSIIFQVGDDSFEAVVIGLDAEGIVLEGSYAGLPLTAHYQAL